MSKEERALRREQKKGKMVSAGYKDGSDEEFHVDVWDPSLPEDGPGNRDPSGSLGDNTNNRPTNAGGAPPPPRQ